MKTDYTWAWPVTYRTQSEAGLPTGEIGGEPDDRRPSRLVWFAWGFALGVLIGLALIDLVDTL